MTPRPLAELLPAAAHLLGVPGFPGAEDGLAGPLRDTLGTPAHIIVLLVDGLGAVQLTEHAAHAPRLAAMQEIGPLAAPFPSTTCVSLTSLGTGLPPGMHGIVGTSFRLDDGSVLAPLSWGGDPNPIATQPEPTVLERAAGAGVLVTTRCACRAPLQWADASGPAGWQYPGADTLPARLAVTATAIGRARTEHRTSLTYVYWPDLDKAAHVHGVASAAYRAELARVDSLVAGLLELVADDVALLVTADHGIIDIPDDRRVDLESRPALRRDVVTILGEPRVRHVYTVEGRADAVQQAWRDELGDRADVRTRAEVADLLGPVDDWYSERIGDVVAIALEDWALTSERVDRIVSALRGQHGGLTDAEVLIPLRAAGGAAGLVR